MAVLHLTKDNFKKEVIESKGTVLVDFWATWCPPCRLLGPIIDEVDKLVNKSFKIAKIDVDEAEEIASQYGIMSVPTMVIFKNGKEVERIMAVRTKEEIIKVLESR